MSELKVDVIYVDLDALLDTRLGTLASIDSTLPFRSMSSNYFTREIDAFEEIDTETFYAAYQARNVQTLKASLLTNIFSLLMSFVKSQIEDIVQGGQNGGLEICLNTHPYELSQQETVTLMQVVQLKLGEHVAVSNIHMSDKELTPTYCKDHFAAMVRYSFDEWMETHLDEWMTVKMPQVAFYAPALYSKLPDQKMLEEFKNNKLHPFQASEWAAAPLFGLRLLEVEMFCISNVIRNAKGFNNKGQ